MERSAAVRFTYQDLLSLPEEQSRRHEILDGQLYVTPGPRLNHQRVARNLLRVMDGISWKHGLGEVVGPMTMHIHDELVLEPDLIFIRTERMDMADPEGHVHGAPDLVVEILSPSTRSYDRALKRKYYLEAGVAELWIVDIDGRTVEVWRPGREQPDVVRESITWRIGEAAFEIPFGEVFRGVEPGT
ncbi:MAG TPA: Uma2 family endonuclease [Longimicrobiales bacterium]